VQTLTVFLDANVLYPAELRSFLLYVAAAGLFQPKWSDKVHEEWISSLLKNRIDLTRQQLARTRRLMEAAAPDATVSGYEALIPKLALPDSEDRHVLAAAIHAGAQVILTANLRHFPGSALRRYGILAKTPEALALELLSVDPLGMAEAAESHRASMKRPPKSTEEYLHMLSFHGMPKTARLLGELMQSAE
jgi:hypothetical protein